MCAISDGQQERSTGIDNDVAGRSAGATTSAQTKTDSDRAVIAERTGHAAGPAAIAAAAADRLRHDGAGHVARRSDGGCVEHFDRPGRTSGSTIAAQRHTNGHRPVTTGKRTGQRKAAIAAAAANRLGQDADRIVASRGDLAVIGDPDPIARAARAARAAKRNAEAGGTIAKPACQRGGPATIAATAADRLGQDAVTIIAKGGQDSRVQHVSG